MTTTVTKEQLQSWTDEVKAGKATWAVISDREDVSVSSLQRKRREFGLDFDMSRIVNKPSQGKLAAVTKEIMQGLIDEYQAGKATWTEIAARYGCALVTLIDKRRRLGFAETYQGQTKSRRPRAPRAPKATAAVAPAKIGRPGKRPDGPAPKIDQVEDTVLGMQIDFVAIVNGYATIVLKGGGAIRVSGRNVVLQTVRREELAAWSEARQRQYRSIKDELRIADRIAGIVNITPDTKEPRVMIGRGLPAEK
jgi:hypothetical protein